MLLNEKEMQFLTRNKIFYKGVIEDNDDPEGYGRVKVRIMGVHSDNKTDVPTSTLPWANITRSLDFGGLKGGMGISSIPQVGTWVYLFFDLGEYDRPVILGAISGKDDGSQSLDGDYMTKHTIKTPAKHTLEFDDGGMSINVIHANGDKIELTSSGVNIISANPISIKGSSTVDIEGTTITLKSSSNTMVI